MSRITSIVRKKIENQTLYNFSVEYDESYICNGVVVHNCKSYITPILKGKLGDREITQLKPSSSDLEKYIQFSDDPARNFCCNNLMLVNIKRESK